MKSPLKNSYYVLPILLLAFLFHSLATAADSGVSHQKETKEPALEVSANVEETWGVKVIGIRLTASDHMLDFRYRVIDPEKAWHFTQKQVKPYLVDQTTGKKLPVQRTRLGPMRQTAVKPSKDRDYTILFANTGKMVKKGDKVTAVIGDSKIENLVIE